MANFTFMEAGSDATGDCSFYDLVLGDNVPVSTTAQHNTGPRSIKCRGDGLSYLVKKGILADAGRRVQVYIRVDALPINGVTPILMIANQFSSEVISVRLTPGGKIQLYANGVQIGSDGGTVSINTWYRLTLTYTITSTTVNTIKCWLGGANLISVTNATLGAVNSSDLYLGYLENAGNTSSQFLYLDDVTVDDSTANTDPGVLLVTCKHPAANNVNSFDTAIGANPANRWTNVNEVPLNTVNGWKQAGTSVVAENYTLEANTAGDVDISADTVVGRSAWVYAKRSDHAGALVQVCANANSKDATNQIVIKNTGLATTSGNTLVIAVAMDNDAADAGGLVQCIDSVGNIYLLAAQESGGGNPGTSVRTLIFYCQNATSVPNQGSWTIIHPNGVKSRCAYAVEFSGISSSPLDKTAVAATTTKSPATAATVTTTQAEEIVFGAIGFRGNASQWNPNHSQTNTHLGVVGTNGPDPNIGLEIQYAIQTSTATQLADGNLNNAINASSVVATFKSSGTLYGSPNITDNNVDTVLTLSTTPDIYQVFVTSASYPSNIAGIGMKSSGTTAQTYLYECGTLIAFHP